MSLLIYTQTSCLLGRYISRLAPQQFQPHGVSSTITGNSASSNDYHTNPPKFDSLAMFGAEQSAYFHASAAAVAAAVAVPISASSSSYHQHEDTASVTTTASQPHYSPITPASANSGFGAAGAAASPAFTFPPTDALLATTATVASSPPIQQRPQPQQQQQFLCPCPSRSTPFEDASELFS